MKDWQEILQEAHNDPIDPAHYTAVRARVLAEIERQHNPWRRLAWLSGVAALIAALFLATPMPRPQLPQLPKVAAPSAAGLLAHAPQPRVERVAHARRVTPRPHRDPLTIKLQTSDPNIVIYWIAD
jgi:hypothetical protein